ncbi:uncharacterized protein [Magallana gigas]|uniref:uncharacterized protein n=1 Tax=Magallana gigas TaxID=29159 RepID=UPI0033427329
MPELLQRSYRDKLVTWIGRPCHFQLLYKISRDGCSASTFHQKCDGQGATVTVLYNTNKTIYGGFLSQSWHSSEEYYEDQNTMECVEEYPYNQESWNSNSAAIYDPDALIFRLQYNGSFNPMKFPVSKASHAGYGKIGYGPTFGRGHDICTFSGTITSSGNIFSLNGHCNLGNSFSLNGENRNTITNNNMKVTDLEVYKVLGKFVITIDVNI